MPLEFLYRFVEQLAFHKLNVLHLHLTDDQGWRLEVDGFPRLTSVGGWRPESMVGRSGSSTFDGTPHGGFYTQEEMTGLARHAADLGVQIVPEIEMPGHARAALAAYRSLGVHGRDLPVWTSWGISEDVFGVHDEALDFCREVLRQVMKVFPGKYLHIGGDEVPTVQWESDPFSRERAAALGLAGPSELHGWFLGEMTRFVASHGRQAVCWEDASTLPRDAIVMAWRDGAGGADGEWPGPLGGTGHGHPVIMAPYRRTYLDYAQTDSPQEPLGQKGEIITLSDVYHFEPEPQGPVLGAQAQLWTEFAATPAEVEYLAYPRLCAFAEVAWGTSSYPSFLRRLPVHLDRLGVRHGEVPA
jgi:hexosaminidase